MKLNQYRLTAAIAVFGVLGAVAAENDASVSPEVRLADRIVIQILANGTYKVGRTPITPSELPVALRVLAGLPETPIIIVLADNDVPYANVVTVLDACHEAKINDVTFGASPAKENK